MAGPPPTVPHPFHPHRKLMDQPGRTLVLLPDNRSAATRRLQERPNLGERHPRVDQVVERRPQAVRMEEDRRGDPDLAQPIYLTNFKRRTLERCDQGGSWGQRGQQSGRVVAAAVDDAIHSLTKYINGHGDKRVRRGGGASRWLRTGLSATPRRLLRGGRGRWPDLARADWGIAKADPGRGPGEGRDGHRQERPPRDRGSLRPGLWIDESFDRRSHVPGRERRHGRPAQHALDRRPDRGLLQPGRTSARLRRADRRPGLPADLLRR